MANTTKILNTFEGGMRQDFHPSQASNNSYRYARNAIHATDEYGGSDEGGRYLFGLTQEQSFLDVCKIPGTPLGLSYLEERDWFIVFTKNGGSEIGYIDLKKSNPTYKKIVNDQEFGCRWDFGSCEWLYAEFKNVQPCGEVQMYWSSNCYYYTANIDVLLDNKRRSDLKCDDFRLFKAVSSPTVSLVASETGGGGILAGSVQAITRLIDDDGNKTNWFQVSKPVYIGGEDNVAGSLTNGSVKITVEQLDTRYNKVEIAVITRSKGETNVESLGVYHHSTNGVTVTYTGRERGNTINPIEVLTKKKKWLRGQDLIQYQGHLIPYKIRQEKNPNLQRLVENAQIEFVLFKVRPEDAHRYKQYQRMERYAFGIVYHYADGTSSPVFHVCGAGGGGAGGSFASSSYQTEGGDVIPKTPGNDTTSIVNGPAGETDVISSGGQGGSSGKEADTFEGYTWEKEKEHKGMQEDILTNFMDENITPTEFTDSDCVDCERDKYQKSGEQTEQTTTDLGDLVKDANESYLPEDDASTNSSSLKDIIDVLVESSKNKEIIKRKKATYTNQREPLPGEGGQDSPSQIESIRESGEDSLPYATFKKNPQFVRQAKKEIVEIESRPSIPWTSAETYPLTKDCNGENVYGKAGQGIIHHEVPNFPLLESTQKGVPNHYQMENHETNDTWYYMVGVRVTGVYLPTDDELPKPLDKVRPWSLVEMERDDVNKHIVATGFLGHTFTGNIQGVPHAFPKNGANSADYFDRHIQSGADDYHIGSDGSNQYVFLSPDGYHKRPALIVDGLKLLGNLTGSGFRHGLYAKGYDEGSPYKDRIDIRACTQALNLNGYEVNGAEYTVDGIGYAPGNKVVKAPKGVDLPLCTMYRESCIYLQLSGGPTYNDDSFVADGLNHERELPNAEGGYAALTQNNPSQYGRLEGARYRDSGVFAQGWVRSAEALTGDTFVGPYAVKRTAYISNKIGNEPLDPPTTIYTALQKMLSFDDCTRPPLSGDEDDNKNKANGYPNQRNPSAGGASQDVYLPKVMNSLLTFPTESETNIYKLELGDPKRNQVHYHVGLKGLYLDSNAPKGTDWTDAYLPQFRCENRRPSKWKRFKAALTRVVTFLFPFTFMFGDAFKIESTFDIQHSVVRTAFSLALWVMMNKMLLTKKTVKRFFDIPECETDDEGGMDYDECIRGWHDHPTAYSSDFDNENNIVTYVGLPDPYNTCDCSSCSQDVFTNELYFSNKQSLESQIDAYRNFESNSYENMPVEAGQIQKLFVVGNSLKIHCTDGIWDARFYENSLVLNEANIGLRSSAGISEPVRFLGGIEQGIFGSWDPNSTINSPWGVFFVDYEAKEIYRYTGDSIETISSYGNRRFFKRFLRMCSPQSCRDEKTPRGTGFVMGWDPRHDRLLFTKQDGEYSFTISYDPKAKRWISFHDYIPQFYAWDRENLYSIKDGCLWKHNSNRRSHQVFYDKYYPFEIEFPVNNGGFRHSFQYVDSMFFTESNIANGESFIRRNKFTFNKAAFYNSDQSTGILDLSIQESLNALDEAGKASIEFEQNGWRINQIKDHFKNKEIPVTESEDCQPREEINNDVDYTYEAGEFMKDNHLIQRFILDDESSKDKQLILFENETTVKYFELDVA